LSAAHPFLNPYQEIMMSDNISKEQIDLPLLPLRDVVVFPHMVIPLFVGRPKSIKALETSMESGKSILLVAQKTAAQDDPTYRERGDRFADAETARRHGQGAGGR